MHGGAETDFTRSVAMVVAGMCSPAVVVALASDPSALPVSGRGIVVLLAAAFGLASWLSIERRGLDRVDFLTVSIVVPWLVLIAVTFLILLLNRGEQIPRGPLADVFRFLIGPDDGFFVYGGSFVLAAAAAVGLSTVYRRRFGGSPRSEG